MIYEVSGDIVNSQAQVIAHVIAPGDHFNQGLALAIRERWPALAKGRCRPAANFHADRCGMARERKQSCW